MQNTAALLIPIFFCLTSLGSELPRAITDVYQSSFNARFLPSGGNISGGGEGYRAGKNCRIEGSQLVDFLRPGESFVDTFKNRKDEPSLHKGIFQSREALEGVPFNLRSKTPRTLALLESKLADWESDSPVTIKVVREQLRRLKWFATPLAFVIKLDNLASGVNVRKYYEKNWEHCENFRDEPFYKWEGPVASFVAGKGVYLNTFLWSRLGDLSRAGLILHESLRSLQLDFAFPISHEDLRDVVNLAMRYKPDPKSPAKLDKLLFAMPSTEIYPFPVFSLQETVELSYACGVNFRGSELFQQKNLRDYFGALKALAASLPPSPKILDLRKSDLWSNLAKVRKSYLTRTLRAFAGPAVKGLSKMSWYSVEDFHGKETLQALTKKLENLVVANCGRFRFNTNAKSIEPVLEAHQVLALHRVLLFLMVQFASEGTIQNFFPNPNWSPEFRLPTVFKNMRFRKFDDMEKGSSQEIADAVGGQEEFVSINRYYDKWYWHLEGLDRSALINSIDPIPWPQTFFGRGLLDLIRDLRFRSQAQRGPSQTGR